MILSKLTQVDCQKLCKVAKAPELNAVNSQLSKALILHELLTLSMMKEETENREASSLCSHAMASCMECWLYNENNTMVYGG